MTMHPDAPIELVDYDSTWPTQFQEERALLVQVIAQWLVGPIEHIGSTAVPGLCAKPVIDMMAPVSSLSDARPALQALASLSYQYFPYRSDVMHWFCKPSAQVRTHHLHLVPAASPLWRERLAFRDRLRQDPTTAAAYRALKQALARRFPHDREAYTEAKGPFVTQVVAAVLG